MPSLLQTVSKDNFPNGCVRQTTLHIRVSFNSLFPENSQKKREATLENVMGFQRFITLNIQSMDRSDRRGLSQRVQTRICRLPLG